MKTALIISVSVCLMTMFILFAFTKQSVVHTKPVVHTQQTVSNNAISQELIPQNDVNSMSHLADSAKEETSAIDTLNTVTGVAENDQRSSDSASSSSMSSTANTKPQPANSKIKANTPAKKTAVKDSVKQKDAIEFGNFLGAN